MYMGEHKLLPKRDLLSRLHLRPENSDVFQMVSRQNLMHKRAVSVDQESNARVCIPKPPSGNLETSAPTRTSICRGELKRKGMETLRDLSKEADLKRKRDAMKSVSMEGIKALQIHFKGVNKAEKRLSIHQDTTEKDHENDDNILTYILKVRDKLGWKTELPGSVLETKSTMAEKYKAMIEEEAHVKDDRGEFVYCLPRCRNNPIARYDPYDLQIVSAATALQSDLYWTVSASHVAKVLNVSGTENMDIIPITEWLHERVNYCAIKNLTVFTQFRTWKAFTVWKINVHRNKTDISKTIMLQQLAFADELFQGSLLYLRSLCEDALNTQLGNKCEDLAIAFVKLDDSRTYSLNEFCIIQSQQSDLALAKIEALREKTLDMITQTFMKVSETEGVSHLFQPESDIKPKYTVLSNWRNLLARFGRYLNLVDCMFQEMLRYLVSGSVQTLLGFLETSSNVTSTEEKKNVSLREEDMEKPINYIGLCKGHRPDEKKKEQQLSDFKVMSKIRRNNVPTSEEERVPVFEVKVVLSTVQNDKIKKQVTFQQDNTADSDEESDQDEVASARSLPISKKVCVLPTKSQFESQIEAILHGFERTIGTIASISQDSCFSKFCFQAENDLKATSSKNTKVERGSHEKIWPNCELLLGLDPDYQNQVNGIRSIINLSMEEVEIYSRYFHQYCSMVETAHNVKMKITDEDTQLMPNDYKSILAMLKEFVTECQQMNIERRVHIVRVNSLEYQEDCLQQIEEVVDLIHSTLPVIAYNKNMQLVEVMYNSLRKLNRELTAVEDFVEHLTFLGQISSELPSLEHEYNVVIQFYSVARDYNIQIPAEELAQYQSLIPCFQQLKSAILFCEAKKDEDIIKFSADLDKNISELHFELMDFKTKMRNPVLLQGDTYPLEAKEIIVSLLSEFDVTANKARCYSSYQERFGSSITQKKTQLLDVLLSKKSSGGDSSVNLVNAELADIECDLSLRKLLWESKEDWAKLSAEWKLTPFEHLNVDMIQREVTRFTHTVFMLEKGLPTNDVVSSLKQSVMDFKESLPIVVALRNPCLQARHWDAIQDTIGKQLNRDKNFTLEDLLELRIFQHKDKIIDTSTNATNEATLEGMLNKVIKFWIKTEFKLAVHQSELSEVMIIASADDIMTQLEESQVVISTIKSSRYAGPIKNLVDEWDRKLNLFFRTMEEWMTCQRNWLYLEQIFLASDIQRQLPAEAKLFSQVDSTWKEIMSQTKDTQNALRAATATGVLDMLQTNNGHLEKILKCLEDFLEIKRKVFPRFYFLSNDDLLGILAESKNPNAIQPHLVKCFENIRFLDIYQSENSHPLVVMMRSAEGEKIPLPKNIRVRGQVEQWLGNVETNMFDVIKKLVKVGVMDWGQSDLKKWLLSHPGQVILIVSQIMFNRDCVRSFCAADPERELRAVHSGLVKRLGELAEMALDIPLPHQKTTLEALLTLYVHCRDVLAELIEKKVLKPDDFEWARQLRYEWNEQTSSCYVVQSNASFSYGYEYLGCSSRLVITPLTDRCWLTLTGALHLHLGGSPAGPAGTGKTETVKDLAKAIGKQCVVFNCSEGLDYKMMGKFFSGMAQSGAWCCFDEFNRIDMEVLSVIASQIHTIKTAKDSNALRFVFEGREIRMNMSCGVFITMNPGYKGRVELPDNLKSLFRPVAMMVPDYQLIAEIMLFSEGFKTAKLLSGKLVNLYQLASKQLSQQNHYDFGMRALKTVLVMAGHKKQDAQTREKDSVLSLEDESLIIINALQEANLPKFLSEDVPLFENIMADLFPGMSSQKSDTKMLEKAISSATQELGLQPWETQVDKVIQFYNQILARHGVMLVGPTGGGKTTVRRILEKALVSTPSCPLRLICQSFGHLRIILKKGKVETFSINPKCVTLGELYGEIDPNTMEWSDGLLASAVRTFAQRTFKEYDKSPAPTSTTHPSTKLNKENVMKSEGDSEHDDSLTPRHKGSTTPHWSWIILDGPVDTVWVENLNTVLDDTKTLCLANSERIPLPKSMRMIFEVDSLSQASPATVSRCAMVYMDPVDLGWKPFVKTWVNEVSAKLPLSGVQYLESLFIKSVDKGLKFINTHKNMLPFPVQELGVVMNLCKILDAFIDFMSRNGGFGHSDGNISEELSVTSVHSAGTVRQASSLNSRSYASSLTEQREEQKWFLEKHPEKLKTLLGKLYLFAFTWAVGGVLKREDEQGDTLIGLRARDESLANLTYDFNSFVYEMFEGDHTTGIQMPLGEKSIFSYFVDLQTGNFVPWEHLIPSTDSLIQKDTLLLSQFNASNMNKPSTSEGDTAHLQEYIDTVDSVRYSFLTSLLLLNNQPILITGDAGVGKSTLIQNTLQKLQKPGGLFVKAGTVLGDILLYNETRSKSLLQNITFLTSTSVNNETYGLSADDGDRSLVGIGTNGLTSAGERGFRRANELVVSTVQLGAHTSAARIQVQIQNKLMKKGRDILGAPKHKKVAVFLDDLNMPIPEQYGAQPPLELIRQFIELGGFYDTKTLTWKAVQDVSLIAACAPPGGGRHEISPRLLKHFCMIVLPHPSVQALQHIFQVQLGSFLRTNNFLAEIQKCREILASSSIAIYYKMCHSMLPTPAKCHYTFNLRDLFKVLQGLLQASTSVIITKEAAAQLLVHEATRVFHDRLIDGKDREMFYQFLSDELHNYFKISWPREKLMSEPVKFVDFMEMNTPAKNRIYRPVTNPKQLQSRLDEYHIRMKMSLSITAGTCVFFKEAVQHITRAARVFRQPGGHMMLVGLDGTGKVTSASLACYIADCDFYRLSITQNYGHGDFREELKKVYKQTGLLGRSTVLLITGPDIVKDSFFEDLNCILNSGEVPDLFDKEELDGIFVELKAAAVEANVSESSQSMLSFFLQRARCKLHVVLALSPAGQSFRQYCRSHPSLVNCCTIDWYDEWDEEALLNVANSCAIQQEFVHDNEELKNSVAQACVEIHKSVSSKAAQYLEETKRHYYITPRNYLSFIETFSNILQTKKQKVLTDRNRYFNGLSKLLEATSSVETMQHELVGLGPQIEQKSKETQDLMEKLKRDSLVVEQVRTIVKEQEEIMAQETKIVQEYAELAVQELAEVLPVLQQAVSALDSLDKADISEVRVYTHPPFLVLTVMNAVCVLLQKKPDWPTAKLLLGDPGFLKRLVNLDKDSVPEKVFQSLKKYSKIPDFNPRKVGVVSTACRSLCQWVLALEHYHEVHKTVEPKQRRAAEAKGSLKLAQEKLKDKQKSLSMVEEHQHLLQKQYSEGVAEMELLAFRKQLTTERLKRASVLIAALDEEKVRWKEAVERLDIRLQGIVGDALVSAAFIVYCGVFTSEYREKLVNEWLEFCKMYNIPVSADYSIIKAMAAKTEVRRWQNEGLPLDPYSTENAILVKNGRHWPLLIDPHGQAYKWICQMEGDKLRLVQASDPSYIKTMENAIRLGEPIFVQDVAEDLDPSLKSIMEKDIYRRAGQDFIKIGDSEIEYNQNFRLYLSTQAPNPHFLPAVCIMVTMINFTVTFKGLQDQLLSSVVSREQPHLETQRCQLLESIAADLCTLRELEKRSLILLQKTEGHLLDDEDLIDTLRQSKITSRDVFKRIEASGRTEATISEACGIYLPVARRGAILYFVVADLIRLNYMYQFSLHWFHQVFVESVEAVKASSTKPFNRQESMNKDADGGDCHVESDNFQSHLNNIIERLTGNVYKIVSSALFTEHQLCFSFMLSTNIMRHNTSSEESRITMGYLPTTEWDFFLHSVLLTNIMDRKAHSENTDISGKITKTEDQNKDASDGAHGRVTPGWLTDSMWRQCQYMSRHFSAFSLLCESLLSKTQQWEDFHKSVNLYQFLEEPYNNPGTLSSQEELSHSSETEDASSGQEVEFKWEKLTSFQKLILVKILRPECLISAIRDFVVETMGPQFLQSGGMNLKLALEESNSRTPLIFILSSGTDPVGQLERLALETQGSTFHLDMVSLGRGQGVKAEELISKAQRLKGRWVFLQNCHLAASFMPKLQEIVDLFTHPGSTIDPDFRLWLSSKTDTSFPIPVLQKGLKLAVEPPQGLKGKLLQTFDSSGTGVITEKIYEKEECGPWWKRLLFSLCFFNAVVNERRKYGALGWNIPYEFTSSDLEVSVQMLGMLMEGQGEVPWQAIHYLTGEVVYGGRVTDFWDRRCLLSILDNFYNPSVLQKNYTFSIDGVYGAVSDSATLQDCRHYVESLPNTDSPEMFGMHPNAERTYLESQAQVFLDTIVSVQTRISLEHIMSRGEQRQDEIALEIISNILKVLPQTVEGKATQDVSAADANINLANLLSQPSWETLVKATKGYDPLINSALLTVLHQEIGRFNHLLSVIHASLQGVQQGIRGEIILNQGLEEVYRSLVSLKVPELWQQCSYESCKLLGAWVDDLIQRIEFFSFWASRVIKCVQGRFGQVLGFQKTFTTRPSTEQSPENLEVGAPVLREQPCSYWISAFFFPQGFLTAVLQNHARMKGISVDSLTFKHQVQPPVIDTLATNRSQNIIETAFNGSSSPDEGILIFGLFLDGAQWNNKTQSIEESDHRHRFSLLPQVQFIPQQIVSTTETKPDEEMQTSYTYVCPLYRTPQRCGTLSSTGLSTNFITAVSLPTFVKPKHWIRRGVAALCQVNE
ncbi:dynein axonemal heavy chain 14 [Discoglossus pictus]